MMKSEKLNKNPYERILEIVLLLGTAAFLGAVVYINFHICPACGNGDTYSDTVFAVRAWEDKSLFPEGWIFGNQYYVLATPVFAALFYGLLKNAMLAMAAASTLMTVLILLAYNYMLRPFASLSARLGGFLAFVTFSAFVGHITDGYTGWQLFFTMDSYYACYLITAMICFGCYLRIRERKSGVSVMIMAAVSCITGFAMGMQSLRQTEIMVLPLIVVEFLMIITARLRSDKFNAGSLAFVVLVSVSNIAGYFFLKTLNVAHVEIFGTQKTVTVPGFAGFAEKILKMVEEPEYTGPFRFVVYGAYFAAFAVAVFSFVLMAVRFIRTKKENPYLTVCFAVITGLGGIAFLFIFSSMEIRNIYFFMAHLLLAAGVSYLINESEKFAETVVVLGVILALAAAFVIRIIPGARKLTDKSQSAIYCEIADFAVENDYKTLYTNWNLIGKIMTAADGKLEGGMWDYDDEEQLFVPIEYLGDSRVFKKNEKPVYVVYGPSYETALKKAAEKGAEITKVYQTTETTWYNGEKIPLTAFTASKPLCTK